MRNTNTIQPLHRGDGMNRRSVLRWCGGAAAAFAAIRPAAAQTYPTRRITIVVPFSPGTAFDTIARVAGQKLAERWGQPVVVENKPGAAGTVGTEQVANAPPDGYTIVTCGAPHTVQPSVIKNLRYDPLTSFTPIAVLATNTVVLVVNPAVFPVNSLDELIAAVKARPGHYNHSSPGVGTLQQLGMELLKQQLGLDILHVPYRGQAQAVTDFLAGQVHMTYTAVNTVLPHVRAGKLRIIAAAGSKRSPVVPEVPTMAELGHPTLDFDLWFGFMAPANTPQPIIRMWEKELAAISSLPDVREALARQGLTPAYMDSAATQALMTSEVARWRVVVEKAGIKPE
jgi:tripartite-type tricarboxylate transporter receptor subunit TctC